MTSIYFRLFLLLVVTTGSVGMSGYLTWKSFSNFQNSHNRLAQSYDLEEIVLELNVWRYDKDVAEKLQVARSQLEPEHRVDALSNVIQAYNDKQPGLLKTRVQFFSQVEKEFRAFLKPQIEFLKSRITYYGSICLGASLISLIFTLLYIQKAVFKPIKDLSQKMVDFLNEKYTYQFSVPEPNEVGHLQGTFNSMAQRVLVNMEELKALDQAKSDFLSIASHELRTPLTSIKGSLSLLRSGIVGEINEAAQNLMNIAQTETDRLIRLINDLLDLAKIEARKFPLSQNWSPLKPMLDATFSGLQGLATTAQVGLRYLDLPPLDVYMDADRIQQVLTNLLSNAIKYSPPKAYVTVTVSQQSDQQLLIEVTDQGKGIDPEDQELIFQKFRQATSPKNPLVKGTGLGLAIAKALVEEHGGQIGVHSTPGQGSTFYFTMPKWQYSKAQVELEQPPKLEVAA